VERASSFGTVADTYDRARPRTPDQAVDWLVPAGAADALDLAAGTGLLTRRLAARVPQVVAVEPDDRMRAVLAERSPDIEALAGTAEAIPLPDAAVDLVTVSSAWHWFDIDRALAEIARVLRPGGRLGVLWTSRDRDVTWVREMNELIPPRLGPRTPRVLEVTGQPFDEVEHATFRTTQPSSVEAMLEQLTTYSGMITATDGERDERLTQARTFLDARFPGGSLDLPVRSSCWRVTRS
jgi:ubiquinone/menaquinone biosynthesis C-methylase UbiE